MLKNLVIGHRLLSQPSVISFHKEIIRYTHRDRFGFLNNRIQKGIHPETPKFPNEYSTEGPTLGVIYDKKPFRVNVQAGKTYAWCSCGRSRAQPFCDGSHRALDGSARIKTTPKFRPVHVKFYRNKEVWFCNCKQTKNRPYCDGTHRREDIQAAIPD